MVEWPTESALIYKDFCCCLVTNGSSIKAEKDVNCLRRIQKDIVRS